MVYSPDSTQALHGPGSQWRCVLPRVRMNFCGKMWHKHYLLSLNWIWFYTRKTFLIKNALWGHGSQRACEASWWSSSALRGPMTFLSSFHPITNDCSSRWEWLFHSGFHLLRLLLGARAKVVCSLHQHHQLLSAGGYIQKIDSLLAASFSHITSAHPLMLLFFFPPRKSPLHPFVLSSKPSSMLCPVTVC